MARVSRDDVMKIATLSKLFVSEEDLDKLTNDMDEIINFADTINNASDDGTEFDNINDLTNVFREDTVVPSFAREEILKNAPDSDEGCFLVKKHSD